ncbi:hypothetical protein BofuT4_uP159200.1 [Botrytis cinerea T4]|uniref:Uncharacterized protein n=1 Tax=Botryotinia fuckeliana (strain T4) TaxID=999810 RepID=G2YU01_BOTF4|nr:hypothetical protein BofuT4_uP159200.1 [Botrytis cinerea T4]
MLLADNSPHPSQEWRSVLSYTGIDGPSFCLAMPIKEATPMASKTHATTAKTITSDMLLMTSLCVQEGLEVE